MQLFLRPGALTREYLDGRRNRYVRPVRLYLTASVALFFLVSILPQGGIVQISDGTQSSSATADSVAAVQDDRGEAREPDVDPLARIEAELEALGAERRALVATRDSLRDAARTGSLAAANDSPDSDTTYGFWDRFGETMGAKGERVGEMGGEGAERWFNRAFASNMPKAMFVLLPLFALLLKGLYVRRGRYFGEHLVFALHTHAFAFFVFIGLTLLLAVAGDVEYLSGAPEFIVSSLSLGLAAAIPLYVVLALRRVYGQGWLKTLAKGFVLMSTYSTALAIGIVAIFLIAFLLL